MGMRWFGIASMIALFVVVAGCKDRPTSEDCAKLLDHVIDIYAASGGVDVTSEAATKEVARQKKKIRANLEVEVVKQCTTSRTTDYVSCAMKAKDSESLAACEVD